MSLPCPNLVGGHGAPCRLEMAHKGSCLPPVPARDLRIERRVRRVLV
ncbi:MAG: hypothetical protein WC876_04450 [Candidatus Thermoplasmatota archaeon]|jgi:hypothetical protein